MKAIVDRRIRAFGQELDEKLDQRQSQLENILEAAKKQNGE